MHLTSGSISFLRFKKLRDVCIWVLLLECSHFIVKLLLLSFVPSTMSPCFTSWIFNHILSNLSKFFKSLQTWQFSFNVWFKISQSLLGLTKVLFLVNQLTIILKLFHEVRFIQFWVIELNSFRHHSNYTWINNKTSSRNHVSLLSFISMRECH